MVAVSSVGAQVPTFGFSSSVSAYFGAYAALWALATAEALDVGQGLANNIRGACFR
jgi:hypothetical protein